MNEPSPGLSVTMASYFMPSFFQKRLLKYALSRVGLVDTEALDLDNLGIRWGQRSTIDLRDIGLKLEKLSNILNLPPSCELLSARVQFLRLTLPADLHNSGIICEANGIDIHIRLLSEESPKGNHGKRNDENSPVPTPSDLAESFLESEPKEEREELQAAIASQSQVLPHDPLAWSTDGDDQELGLGNETLSLPSFVAGFLKGVVDRLQLKIKDVAVRVDMELKQDGASKRQPEDKPDLVAGLLRVGEIDVHGVSETTVNSKEDLPFREGKRLISIANIDLGLISDPLVFSNYSRFAAPPSPTTTMRSKGSQQSSRAPSLSPLDTSDSEPLAMTRSTILEPLQVFGHLSTTEHDLGASEFSQDGRFSDADSESGSRRGEYMEDSQIFGDDPFQDNPGYLDSVIDNRFDDFDEQHSPVIYPQENRLAGSEGGSRSQPSFGPESMYQSQHATYSEDKPIPTNSYHSSQTYNTHQSQLGSEVDEVTQPIQHCNTYDENEHNERSRLSASSHSSTTSPVSSEPDSTRSQEETANPDLNESKYFSHDEAQSLYMSAISQEPSESFMPNMPGAWGSFGGTSKLQDAYSDRSTNTVPFDPAQSTQVQDGMPLNSTAPLEESVTEHHDLDTKAQSQSLHKDRPPTPSSPGLHRINEMRKSVLTVDKILLWVSSPTSGEEITDGPSPMSQEKVDIDLKESTAGFGDSAPEESLLASRAYKSNRFERGSVEPQVQSSSGSELPEIAVEVFSVSVHFDIAIGWLITKIGQKVLNPLSTAEKAPSEQQSLKNQPERTSPVHLVVHAFSINFIEHVSGHLYSSDNSGSPLSPPYSMEDAILRLTLSGLDARISAQGTNTKLNLNVSKFAFGFASEDIVFFDETLKMRESTRDVLSPSQGDISISLVKSVDLAKVDISTLPLHINLNIQRLEEALGWMGGLSTILELGSSISSVSTVKGSPQTSKQRPRGVHFETPAPVVDTTKNTSTLWKVNGRVGAILLDVAGETHCLQLTTTAVKVVSRFEGIGIQIDKAKLIGPLLLDDTSADAPAKITLNNIRLEFLFAPKEVDLDRLLTLITPSQDKFEEEDDIMLDTLLRQRRQGSVLRVTIGGLETFISDAGGLEPLSSLGMELSRLSTVTKYLPEDDRPGILTLMLVRDFHGHVHVGGEVGDIKSHFTDVEVAHITMPSLTAAQIGTMTVIRNDEEHLVGQALWPPNKYQDSDQSRPPVLMARFIPDEMDPTYKIKLHNLLVEYTVPSVTAFLGLGGDKMSGDLASSMVNSIANLAEHSVPSPISTRSQRSDASIRSAKPLKLAIVFRDCVLGLNPRNSPAKGLIVLTNAKFGGSMHDESAEASLDIRKASLMIIDDVWHEGADNLRQRGSAVPQTTQAQTYIDKGYVPVSSISSATAGVKLISAEDGTKSLDVELRDDLLILETCADSTQTLISIMNGLQPPTPPSIDVKYRTEITPIQDMFASFTGDAFAADPKLPSHDNLTAISEETSSEDQLNDELEYVSDFYPVKGGADGVGTESLGAGSNDLLNSFHSQYEVSSSLMELDFQEDHFAKKSAVGGTAHRWDSTQNTYSLPNDTKLERSPLRVRVRDVHLIWNLFDGYDWQRTRDTISRVVKDVETKATERRARGSRVSALAEDEEESVIGDFLFNSIYIGIPANKDPRELHREINHDIDDFTSETGSYATSTTVTGVGSRQGRPTSKREKKLRLHRSKHHKMTFELKGISADLIVFPPGSEETQSSLDVRVKDLEIYDHVPTSTWKKFATYMREAGEKESGTSMVHLEVLTVKPVPELAASEIVLKATVLPLRLHVDQDALDFMSRFFEFRDETAEPSSSPGDVPFLQRVEINAVQVKLDFKPKRVDYAGLRSGRTTEFMNFFVLDGADMVLRHVIIYGVSGFDRLGQTLNDIWMPDVKKNQLPGVLAGLAPIRSLVNVGGGVRDLVVIPMREYKKDGRIVRSIQKGALAFAKTTSNELVKLGAKLAIGTQTVLQGAEDLLTTPNAPTFDDDSLDEDEAKKISLYADQPVGVVQGLRGAFSGLERDLLLARDAIVAVPGEVVESGSAKAAAKAVWKRAPTVILRPAIGVSKAVGQTLLGAGNSLDPSNRRKMEDKYKRY